jgi:REP element-mobilizing transposase RayT
VTYKNLSHDRVYFQIKPINKNKPLKIIPMNMSKTYTKLYVHIVFSVRRRQNLLLEKHDDELYKYITGIVNNKKQKLMAINGTEDHIHILVSIAADICVSDLVRHIKANSSRFINENRWIGQRFEWQEGFGAFSYNESMKTVIINYIHNQKVHHKRVNFQDEYKDILQKFDVDFNSRSSDN